MAHDIATRNGPISLNAEGTRILVVDAVLLAIATTWVGLRFYARRIRKTGILDEDWIILAALVLYAGLVVASYLMVIIGGFSHHLSELDLHHVTKCLKLAFVTQVLYAASLGLVKISICVMFARVFFMPIFKVAAVAAMTLSTAWAIMTILIGILICRPIQMNWDPTTKGGKCGNQTAAFSSVGVVDIITDVIILVLPIPFVLKLQMPPMTKAALVAIFCLGFITTIIGGLRLWEVLNVDFTDFPSTAVPAHVLSMVEPAVGIVVSSSITLRPVFEKIFYSARDAPSSGPGRSLSRAHGGLYSHFTSNSQNKNHGLVNVDELHLTELDPEYAVKTNIGSASTEGSENETFGYEPERHIHVNDAFIEDDRDCHLTAIQQRGVRRPSPNTPQH